MLFRHLEWFFLPTVDACSFFGPLRDHSLRHRSVRLLATHACASQSTLATVPTTTCHFAWRSRGVIVQTLDDLILVISVTPLCPLGRTPHADVSIACMLCIALQHGRDHSPLQRRWTRQVTFAADQQTRTYTSHSHGGLTESTQSSLAINAIETKENESFRATRTECTGSHSTSFPFHGCFLCAKYHVCLYHRHARAKSTNTQPIVPLVARQYRHNVTEECARFCPPFLLWLVLHLH